MAVMTTQQPEGALLSEKPLSTSLELEKDARNGSADVNGYVEEVAPKEDEKPTPSADTKLGPEQNNDAFSANSAIKADSPKPVDSPADISVEIPEVPAIATPETEAVKADGATPVDTEMVDAPVSPVNEEKAESQDAPKPQSDPQPEAEAEVKSASQPAPVPAPETQSDAKPDADDAPVELAKKEDSVLSSAAVSPTTKLADDIPPVDEKEDVVMADVTEPVETAESTQETALSDVPPVTPAADGDSLLPTPPVKPEDAAHGTPPPTNTADTSMSEPAQSAKVSRERDIDSEDEPVAKRTKVEHSTDVKKEQDAMDVDKKPSSSASGQASLYLPNGQPKRLDDDSLDQNPVTDWQNKQIRGVLAGVKKTKVGANFRQPVGQLWPDLWSTYSLRVTNPIDISTMEKKFRGELNGYKTMGDFKRDLQLLVDNSIAFNGENHDVTRAAQSCRESILSRLNGISAVEPARPDKKDSIKQHPTRHTEPRPASHQSSASAPSRPPKPASTGAAASPAPKPAVENPAFAIPPGNNGVPLIRRDSTKNDSRTKRPIKGPPSKDLVYDQKRKKKLPPELRFCEEVLMELRKSKHFEFNGAFLQPVDPVALNIPHYHKIIKKPMDLGTMGSKLQLGEYTSAKDFERDFELIVKNCKTFNGEDHIVYAQALRLQRLFSNEMAKKGEWMAKNAPVAPANHNSPRGLKDESEDEEEEVVVDPHEEERKAIQAKIDTIQKRLSAEQKNIDDLVNGGSADLSLFETSTMIVKTLQMGLIEERQKLAALPARGAATSKPAKTSKPKKSGGASHVSGVAKKATTGGGHGASGSVKKPTHKKAAPPRKITDAERAVITEYLGELEGPPLERAIDLIKKDTGQGENDLGELELDIESLSEGALVRLYDLIVKHHPQAKKKMYSQAPADPPAKANKPTGTKSKKNKPMSKSEQERRIQQLNALRAQASRNASGSQEPMESIEGTGRASAEPTRQQDHDSDDEDSEED
ncbi:hypothetical protein QBC35DRAFT_394969 [Podospora australis]|uniref:Bromodomain-containing factor 1 n=1 Tax=Podospora australis TaxID=1536484 RepID=A0AAN7AEJ0_9PEZI|nr:hypothetical protein QBC35DRAFT_394969 [Podospora australis]